MGSFGRYHGRDIAPWTALAIVQRHANHPHCFSLFLTLAGALAIVSNVWGAALYWDINGPTAGAGGVAPSAEWYAAGFKSNWNASSNGTGPDIPWTAGGDAVFAAGNDATGAYAVTVTAATTLASLTVEEGSVSLAGSSLDFGATSGAPINVFAGASLTQTSNNQFKGTEGLTKTGAGVLYLRSTNTFSRIGGFNEAYLTISNGTVDFTADSQLGAVPASANLTAITLNGGALRFSGPTSVSLSGNRGVTIGPGNGTIDVANATTLTLPNAKFTGSGTLTKVGNGRLDLGNLANTFSGKYVVTGGSIAFTSGAFGAAPATFQADNITLDGGMLNSPFGASLTSNRGVTLGPAGGYLTGHGDGLWVNGVISGNSGGGLTITNGDAVGISIGAFVSLDQAANTYESPTTIKSSEVRVRTLANGGLPSSIGKSSNAAANLVLDGGTLASIATTTQSTDRRFTLTPAGGKISSSGTGGAALNFTSTSPISLVGAGPRSLTLTGANSAQNSMSLAITDQDTSPTSLQIDSTWLLTNTGNSYSGNTSITGRLRLGASEVVPNSSKVSISGNGSLELNGFDETVKTVSGTSGTIVLGAKKLTFANPTGETFSGIISGASGRIVKKGAGTLTLSGANTYKGDTEVQAGTLQISSPYLADSADVYLASGSVLNLSLSGTDVIDSLFINGVSQATGTWGSLTSTATHKSNLFAGTGLLQVSTQIGGVPGDFNSNGIVDNADYVVWRNSLSSSSPLANDNALGTPIGQAHYNLWRSRFGATSATGSTAVEPTAVPEPGSVVLIAAAAFCFANGHGRARLHRALFSRR